MAATSHQPDSLTASSLEKKHLCAGCHAVVASIQAFSIVRLLEHSCLMNMRICHILCFLNCSSSNLFTPVTLSCKIFTVVSPETRELGRRQAKLCTLTGKHFCWKVSKLQKNHLACVFDITDTSINSLLPPLPLALISCRL